MAIQRHSGLGPIVEIGELQPNVRGGYTLAAPFTDEKREAILSQLGRVLASPPFNASKRYPAFLKYVVEQTLDGKAESLKERTLGIDVFERGIEYDTNADPIVRIIAGEVRKRLAQYYYDLNHTPEIRIELPSGSYIPEFSQSEALENEKKPEEPLVLSSARDSQVLLTMNGGAAKGKDSEETSQASPLAARSWKSVWTWAVTALVVLAIASIAIRFWPRPSAVDLFWKPMLAPSKTILICMGQLHVNEAEITPNAARSRFDATYKLHPEFWPKNGGVMLITDATTAANLGGLLKMNERDFVVRDKDSTTFGDLQNGPSVLIGAFSNDWTIRLTDPLRYHFDRNPAQQQSWIADRQRPDLKIGLHKTDLPESPGKQDYAIVARIFDPGTRQPIVVLAGVDAYGTQVAGDFVTHAVFLNEFAKDAPRDWYRKNIEILLSTNIVDGAAGPPRVVDSFFW